MFNSVFGEDVVIVDGFAPFRWIGPGAEARWWTDAETWGKAGGVLKEHLSFEEIRCCEVSGTRAYAVLSATLTITLKAGEPIGILPSRRMGKNRPVGLPRSITISRPIDR